MQQATGLTYFEIDTSRLSQDERPSEIEVPDVKEMRENRPAVHSLMFPFMFMFQGYGAMVGDPQHALKVRMGIHSFTDDALRLTGAVNLFQWGKTSMRIAQIVFLLILNPFKLVVLAHAVMLIALLILLIFIYQLNMHKIYIVGIAYTLGGVAVGIFEGTYLAIISSLGKNTKSFAILGAPLGFAMINTVLGTMEDFGMPPEFYYIYTIICIPVGLTVFLRMAPREPHTSEGKGCGVISGSVQRWEEWLPAKSLFKC